jgi:hypothetical protein
MSVQVTMIMYDLAEGDASVIAGPRPEQSEVFSVPIGELYDELWTGILKEQENGRIARFAIDLAILAKAKARVEAEKRPVEEQR